MNIEETQSLELYKAVSIAYYSTALEYNRYLSFISAGGIAALFSMRTNYESLPIIYIAAMLTLVLCLVLVVIETSLSKENYFSAVSLQAEKYPYLNILEYIIFRLFCLGCGLALFVILS